MRHTAGHCSRSAGDQSELVLANARIVLADAVVETGWLAAADGLIVEVGEGSPPEHGEDLGGDLLLPGLVELHTDHLENHYVPRPKVFWDPVAAVVSFDGQLATSGITTVLDSVRIWREEGIEEADGQADLLARAITQARASDLLRVEHFLHLRCEVPMPTVVVEASALIGLGEVRLASMMDHTPGQRQFRDERKLRDYYRGKKGSLTDAELDRLFAHFLIRDLHKPKTNKVIYFKDNVRFTLIVVSLFRHRGQVPLVHRPFSSSLSTFLSLLFLMDIQPALPLRHIMCPWLPNKIRRNTRDNTEKKLGGAHSHSFVFIAPQNTQGNWQ